MTRNFNVLAIIILMAIVLLSCENNEFEIDKLIGTWKVDQWTIENTGQSRNNQMDMTFANEGIYEVDYGSELEKGRYWVNSEYLYTVEQDQNEKRVKIIRLSNDTLEIKMNRGGEIENVLLLRSRNKKDM